MKKILLFIADGKRQAEFISVLVRLGHHLVVARGKERAWQCLLEEKSRPDLVVMYLPQEGAADFLKSKHNIREFREIPILFLEKGSKEEETRRNQETKHPYWSHLCLPTTVAELTKRVGLLLAFYEKGRVSQSAPVQEILTYSRVIKMIDASQEVKRLLLVEAIGERRKLLARFLELEGFEVITATSAQTAWPRFCHSRPDLVIWSTCSEGTAGWNQFIEKKGLLLEHKEIPLLFFVQDDGTDLDDLNDWGREVRWQAIPYDFNRASLLGAIRNLIAATISGA